ncbi:hypothetical protein PoHVEF18_004294 [Penicillium ochrochloron]
MDVDVFTRKLVAAGPLPVQQFFTSLQWDVNDILAFDKNEEEDKAMIVYGDCIQYVVDNNDQEIEPYAGFTEYPPSRMATHRSVILNAAHTPDASSNRQYVSSEDVKPNFRLLGMFPPNTDAAYGPLLESLFMVLLSSFQDHGSGHDTQ